MLIEHDVLFLPTKQSYRWGDLVIDKVTNKVSLPEFDFNEATPMTITVIANDKIIKGDHVICVNPGIEYYGLVFRVTHKFANGNLSLEYKEKGLNERFNPEDFKRVVGTSNNYLYGVPKVSKDFKSKFIVAYNTDKKITKVLVDYKNEIEVTRREDNTLILHKIKYVWTKGEHISGLRHAFFAGQPIVDEVYMEQKFQKYLESLGLSN